MSVQEYVDAIEREHAGLAEDERKLNAEQNPTVRRFIQQGMAARESRIARARAALKQIGLGAGHASGGR